MAFGFGNLGPLQQRLGAFGNDSYLMDDMSGGALARAKAAMPMAAPGKPPAAPGQAPTDPSAPPSDVGSVATGLPKMAPPTDGGGSGLSSLFDELFGGGDATMMLMG